MTLPLSVFKAICFTIGLFNAQTALAYVSPDTTPEGYQWAETSCRWNAIDILSNPSIDQQTNWAGSFIIPSRRLPANAASSTRSFKSKELSWIMVYQGSFSSPASCSNLGNVMEIQMGEVKPPTRTPLKVIDPWVAKYLFWGTSFSPSTSTTIGFASALTNINGNLYFILHGGKNNCGGSPSYMNTYTYSYSITRSIWVRFSNADVFGSTSGLFPKNCAFHPLAAYTTYIIVNCDNNNLDMWVTNLQGSALESETATTSTAKWRQLDISNATSIPTIGGGRMTLVAADQIVWLPRIWSGNLPVLTQWAKYYNLRVRRDLNLTKIDPTRLSFTYLPDSNVSKALNTNDFKYVTFQRKANTLIFYDSQRSSNYSVYMYDIQASKGFRPSVEGDYPTTRQLPINAMYGESLYVATGIGKSFDYFRYLNCTGYLPETSVVTVQTQLQFGPAKNYSAMVTADSRFWGNIVAGVLSAFVAIGFLILFKTDKLKLPSIRGPSGFSGSFGGSKQNQEKFGTASKKSSRWIGGAGGNETQNNLYSM